MTEPQQDDLTADDERVERTDNGWQPGDPTEQPPQARDHLPAGTVTGDAQ